MSVSDVRSVTDAEAMLAQLEREEVRAMPAPSHDAL